jgi:carboxyl-terminal processing protease
MRYLGGLLDAKNMCLRIFVGITSCYARLSLLAFVVTFASFTTYADANLTTYSKDFQEVFQKIERLYVQQPDKEKMLEAALKGMLYELDPHSAFLNKEEYKELNEQTKGEFGGIGIEIIPDNNVIQVISPIDDLPAAKAGIQPGDHIIEVDGEMISNLGYIKAVQKMRGTPGTKVKISIIREGENKPIDLELTREIVKIHVVKSNLDGKVGYLRVSSFNEHTIEELKKAVRKLQEESKGKLAGFVLDLRNNPGGLLDQAIKVSDFFLDNGVIVSIKGRNSTNDSSHSASIFNPKAPKLPLVVLINSGSASASEIVAGAIQDHKRGIIIGTKSFGKGSVQTVIPTLNGAMKLTTAKYYTPSGRSIQAEGIEPDIIVEQAKVEYGTAAPEDKRYSEAKLKNHLENDKKITKSEREAKIMSELYKRDYQYARGYDVILALEINNKLKGSQ